MVSMFSVLYFQFQSSMTGTRTRSQQYKMLGFHRDREFNLSETRDLVGTGNPAWAGSVTRVKSMAINVIR